MAADTAGLERARWAVTGVFFVNALLMASYIDRIPSLRAGFGLPDALLGVVLTGFGVAALVAMRFAGRLVGRFGSARVIRLGLMVTPVLLLGIGAARTVPQLVVAIALTGAVHGTVDVSMNAHAVAVERRVGRPIMNGCHAAWSVGAVVATLLGAALIRGHVAPEIHFLCVGAAAVVVGWAVSRRLLPASADRDTAASPDAAVARVSWRAGWTWTMPAVCLAGMIIMVSEGAVVTWSGIYLRDVRGAPLAVAALGYATFSGFQTVGRVVGDAANRRFGAPRLFAACAAVAALGVVVVVATPSAIATLAGFAVMGAGTSVLLPLVFSTAGHAGGDGPRTAAFVSRVSTFTYGAVLLGPAVVGWSAQGVGLRATFAALVPLLLVVALFGRHMTAPSPNAPEESHEVPADGACRGTTRIDPGGGTGADGRRRALGAGDDRTRSTGAGRSAAPRR